MAKGVTELVEDFKELHPRAYARIYNQALDELLDRIDLMFLYKDTNGVFHSASYANLNRKSIQAVVEQLKK